MSRISFLHAMWIVLRKELRDFTRDRRTLMLSLFIAPLMYPLMFLGADKLATMRRETQLDKPLQLPVAGMEQAPNLMAHLASLGIIAKAAPQDIEARIRAQQEDLALIVDEHFAEDWRAGRPAGLQLLTDTTRRTADVSVARVRAALDGYSRSVASLRLLARGINPAVAAPLNTGTRDLATVEAKRGALLTALLPLILVMFAFIGGAHLAMDTTAGERERQSLEPLLTTPVARGALVSGKMLSAVLLGATSILLILLSFKISAGLVRNASMSMDVSFAAMGKLLLVLLPLLLIGTALLTLLAAAAKSMKEAQSHLVWLMMLPMLPVFALSVYPVKDTLLWLYAAPFLSQSQMIQKITRGEAATPEQWMVYLLSSLALAALLWLAAVWRYRQEKLAISA
ncbi:MAG: ABC transporter permease [Nevskiaceae bacterium]|jgi:sodium transport system permease protein|nr:ABC transporter permease [Nevskiaceae bacterium]